MRFTDKRVVVTGASRGLGHAIATAFRNEGAWVIGTRTSSSGEEGPCQQWVAADFGSRAHIDACAARLAAEHVDVLVNNAGINRIAPFADIDPDDFLAIQQVNVFAPFRLSQAVV